MEDKETLEEASHNAWLTYEHVEGNLYSTSFKNGFKLGAKWEQEQDKNKYSEEDVRGMLEDMSRYVSTKEMIDDFVGVGYSEWVRKRDWFVNHLIEQFKNK